MAKPKFKIYTLGCKVNQYDSSDLCRKMISAGFDLVDKQACIAIINTCCVTQTAIHKCKRMINKARKENPKAKIVVMGCWSVAYRDEVEKLDADFVWGVGELDKLIIKIQHLCEFPEILHSAIAQFRMTKSDRSRYFIKIQDGCEQFCSYCIIPYTRGKLRSRPITEVINEVKQAIEAGYREVVLCGIHLGLYLTPNPSPRTGEGRLAGLIKKLIKIKDLGRIRLSSIEVTEVSDELIKLMAANKKICKHLHIPLQSGCDKILKSMNRPYDKNYFENKIRKIRKAMLDITVTTDVIVGFPDETEKDFKETYNFVKKIKFSRLHVFPFSVHEKTLAFKMSGKAKKEEIEKRAKKLRGLGKNLEDDYRKKFIGRELDVLVENRKSNNFKGKTEYYFDIEFGTKQIATDLTQIATDVVGKIIKVKI